MTGLAAGNLEKEATETCDNDTCCTAVKVRRKFVRTLMYKVPFVVYVFVFWCVFVKPCYLLTTSSPKRKRRERWSDNEKRLKGFLIVSVESGYVYFYSEI